MQYFRIISKTLGEIHEFDLIENSPFLILQIMITLQKHGLFISTLVTIEARLTSNSRCASC